MSIKLIIVVFYGLSIKWGFLRKILKYMTQSEQSQSNSSRSWSFSPEFLNIQKFSLDCATWLVNYFKKCAVDLMTKVFEYKIDGKKVSAFCLVYRFPSILSKQCRTRIFRYLECFPGPFESSIHFFIYYNVSFTASY